MHRGRYANLCIATHCGHSSCPKADPQFITMIVVRAGQSLRSAASLCPLSTAKLVPTAPPYYPSMSIYSKSALVRPPRAKHLIRFLHTLEVPPKHGRVVVPIVHKR